MYIPSFYFCREIEKTKEKSSHIVIITIEIHQEIMKKLIMLSILISFFQLAECQENSATYKVTNYTLNGVNYDDLALENDVSLTFYTCENNSLCFANHWRKKESQSYGGVFAIKTKDYPETENSYARKELKFTWKYFNTYDSKRGEAAVTITNIYIGSTIKFVAEIIVLDTNEVIELKGYLE